MKYILLLCLLCAVIPHTVAQQGDVRLTEKEWIQVRDNYRFQLKDAHKADSVETLILAEYPWGEAARFIAYNKAREGTDRDKVVENFEHFLAQFPVQEWQQHPEQQNQEFIYYTVYRALIEALMGTEQYEKARSYADQMYFKALNEVYRWNIEGLLKIPHFDFTDRYPVADAYMRQMVEKQGDGTMNGMGADKADELAQSQFNTRLSAHIRVLDRLGRYEEAREFYQHLSPGKRYADSDLNETYMHVLEQVGSSRDLKELLEEAVRVNVATPAMLEKLERMYVAEKGSDEGFVRYFDSLKSAESLEAIRKKMLAELIDVPYKHFSLEDSEGKMINSADWGDKVVILDFWGTWCNPCVRAFPGMQLAVDKYAGDPEVAFGFVSTDDTVENVERFIKRNNYTFHWLYDLKTAKNDKPGAVYKYFRDLLNVSGVPCKVAVKSGRVRYVAIGYGGSPSLLADELSILIEILKSDSGDI